MITLNPGQPVGFIGIGVMGRSMAAHILHAGHPLVVHTRSREKAQPLIADGARWANSPAEIAAEVDTVCTMVGYPHDVREVYLGDRGLIRHGKRGALYCDFTTSSPALAQEIEAEADRHGIHVLDAPVSGGDVGARNGTLSIMCGGRQETFDALLPLLQMVGRSIVYMGPAGAGQHTKMCNQIAVAGTMVGMVEALMYAEAAGLDSDMALQAISGGAAGSWTLSNLAPRILNGNFEPGFYVEHLVKDLDIALEESERLGVPVPGLSKVRELYEKVVQLGAARKGTHALYLAYRAMRGAD